MIEVWCCAVSLPQSNLPEARVCWGWQYLTRPFVVGDRVELKSSGGGTIVMGVVESISVRFQYAENVHIVCLEPAWFTCTARSLRKSET